MELPRLIAITEPSRWSPARTVEVVRSLCERARPGSVGVQLRGRAEPARRLLALGEELSAVTHASGQFLIVNDRLDLARLLRADGVHLGEASVSNTDARRLGPFRWLFRACHSPEAASIQDADALLLSPIVAPRKGAPALGLPGLERARRALADRGSPAALFALGGVTPDTAASCLAAGAFGVAAMGAVFDAPDPAAWIEALAIARDPSEDAG